MGVWKDQWEYTLPVLKTSISSDLLTANQGRYPKIHMTANRQTDKHKTVRETDKKTDR